MPKLFWTDRQRAMILLNGRAIRYQELSVVRPLRDRIYSIYEDRPVYREYDPVAWVDCAVLDTSDRRHEFRVRDEDWPRLGERTRQGRQILRLRSSDYPPNDQQGDRREQ